MFSETMIKTLLKTVDLEKLMDKFLSDPRVSEAQERFIALCDDFAAIKRNQEKILALLEPVPAPEYSSGVENEPLKLETENNAD